MLELFWTNPSTLEYLRRSATGPYLDRFADALAQQGYAGATVRRCVAEVGHLGHWLADRRVSIQALDEGVLDAYDRHLPRCRCVRLRRRQGRHRRAPGPRCFLQWMRTQGLAPAAPLECVPPMIRAFERWMHDHRGTRPSTLKMRRHYLRRFLATLGDEPSRYEAPGIRRFILDLSQQMGISGVKSAISAVRMLLRHLAISGRCPPTLVDSVPTVAHWKLAALPAYISREEVERILGACDTATAFGRRDRAMLLLMARLGLRAGDVAALRLDDIDWQDACISVSGKSRRAARLPLPQDVGDAILAWLGDERRRDVADEHVFVRVRAPRGPLGSSSVSLSVGSAAKRAGVKLPRGRKAHVLRHSLATGLLDDGMSLAGIGAVLRHQDLETTAIYAKVHRRLLASLVRAWPEEVPP